MHHHRATAPWTRRRLAAAALLCAAVGLVGCSSDDEPAVAGPEGSASTEAAADPSTTVAVGEDTGTTAPASDAPAIEGTTEYLCAAFPPDAAAAVLAGVDGGAEATQEADYEDECTYAAGDVTIELTRLDLANGDGGYDSLDDYLSFQEGLDATVEAVEVEGADHAFFSTGGVPQLDVVTGEQVHGIAVTLDGGASSFDPDADRGAELQVALDVASTVLGNL